MGDYDFSNPDGFNGMVKRCARCGGDHDDLFYKRMSRPVVDDDGTVWGHWAVCPDSGDPILLTNRDKEYAALWSDL